MDELGPIDKYLEINKLRLHYLDWGSQGKQPMLLLHGFMGHARVWDAFAMEFRSHYHVISLDQRGHGESDWSEELAYKIDDHFSDICSFVETLALGSIILVGHSMGGKTAMEFALAYPALVEKLVVVDIAPRAYPPHHDDLFDALCSLDLSQLHTRREVDAALGERIESVPVRMFLMKNLKRTAEGHFAWKMNLPVIRAHYSEVNRAVSAGRVFPNPALFIRATAVDYLVKSDEEAIAELFPKARIAEFDTGHWVHAESPEPFYRRVREFLEKM